VGARPHLPAGAGGAVAHEVLYRRWRPNRFAEIVGQEPVTTTLRHAVASGSPAHAYLFTGPRGTGKTSTGRILATAVNCREPADGEPCGACESCRVFDAGAALDLIELDAASNRGIDEMRDLREGTGYAPAAATYKLYLVDEVHMLTDAAFNALLKTLEEPPPHVIFVLATTEPHRVPATISSRCQRFDFRRIGTAETVSKLRRVAEGEGIAATEEALELIARHATGSMRDAESLLDQLSSYREGEVDAAAVRAGLGDEAAQRLAEAVLHHLLLPDVATRRDISDERVIREVADTVGDMRTLNLLYVLSVADARACGSDVWNAWKAQLMRSLYLRVSEELSGVSLRTPAVRRDAAVRELSGRVEPQAVEAHLNQMPIGYLLSMEPEAIGRHIELIDSGVMSRAATPAPVAPVLHHDQLGNLDRITIVTGDRPGILQAVAGSLAVHNVNVLGGTAYTRDDGVAIDVMHVGDGRGRGIDEQRWERIFDSMSSALAGEFPIESRLAAARASYGAEPAAQLPTTVEVDNASSDEYSIVEVHAADRLGLLYTITTALRDMSLDIHMAKVNTFGDEIVDAFYVRRQNGLRIEASDEIERLVARITAAVAALDAGEPVRAS